MSEVGGAAVAYELAEWACNLAPSEDDLALAQRSLLDTLGVILAARDHPIRPITIDLSEAARWATIGHVLDFDDLHVESTTHISVVCIAAALACGGDARAYLAGAGAMARLGVALGWNHYSSGWHATCTAGAPAAAVVASIALGLDVDATARAIVLAVPGAGGVQRAFGTDEKSLQVGFATDAGVRAAHLAKAGASADPSVLDEWLALVGGDRSNFDLTGPAVPGGLAIKLFPCCYAMQRPIESMRELRNGDVSLETIERIHIRTPAVSLHPLIHHRPKTALEGKFSLEYAMAAALLDGYPGFASFSDEAVNRPDAERVYERLEIETTPGGDSLLFGDIEIELNLADGTRTTSRIEVPAGAPSRPPNAAELKAKLADCGADVPDLLEDIDWISAVSLLRKEIG